MLVAAISGLVVVVIIRGSGQSEGSLSNLGADPLGYSIPLDVGESASISGPFVVKNTGARPLRLDHVELVGLQNGITLRGASVVPYPQHPAGPRPRSAEIGIVLGYRLSRSDRLLRGATVAPHAQIAIVLGVTAARRGRHAWHAVDVIYDEGGQAYTLRTPLAARVCVPRAPYADPDKPGCPTPDPLDA
jgi:hypothetical protein